jgi:hypothetical protein
MIKFKKRIEEVSFGSSNIGICHVWLAGKAVCIRIHVPA